MSWNEKALNTENMKAFISPGGNRSGATGAVVGTASISSAEYVSALPPVPAEFPVIAIIDVCRRHGKVSSQLDWDHA